MEPCQHGLEIDAYYLKESSGRPVITVDTTALEKPRRWREGKGNTRFGYPEVHFADALMRYLKRLPPSKTGAVGYTPSRQGVFDPTQATHPTREANNAAYFNSSLRVGWRRRIASRASDAAARGDAFGRRVGWTCPHPRRIRRGNLETDKQHQVGSGSASDALDGSDEMGTRRRVICPAVRDVADAQPKRATARAKEQAS